jgi:citrate synthase
MNQDLLFKITTQQLETGLRGFPVGYCPTSYVDPQKGLFYCNKPVSELAYKEPKEVIYLLYEGRLAKPEELTAFVSTLKKRAPIDQKVLSAIYSLPREGHPMEIFPIALILLGIFEKTGDYREDCLNLIAKLPHLVASVINHHAGWGITPSPMPQLGYIENFVHLLNVPQKNVKALTQVFKLFSVLHYDHGGGNLSTFVGKAVASGLEDLFGSIASAMCALAGPRHGRANQDCLEFVQEVLNEVGENASLAEVEALIRRRLQNKQLLFGFGHAVLRVEDPRATVEYEFLKKHYPNHPLVKIALALREAGPKALIEDPKIADPYPNVDAVSGAMLSVAGFPYPEYYTLLFGFARSVGIAIQIVYERLEARNGKGTPIVRPKYLYKARS